MSTQVDRLGLQPFQRITVLGGLASTYGFFHGVAKGAKLASLSYLAENAHRLPKTRGTWYFFHKRKNYVILKQGIDAGIGRATKYGVVTAAFFGLEAWVDNLFGSVSWISTSTSAFVTGSVIVAAERLNWKQSFRSVRNFTLFGVAVGLIQDRVRSYSQLSRQMRLESSLAQEEEAKKETAKEDSQTSAKA